MPKCVKKVAKCRRTSMNFDPKSDTTNRVKKYPQKAKNRRVENRQKHCPVHENAFSRNAEKKHDIAKHSPLCSETCFLDVK